MKIEKISYQKLFPLGMYINERVGMEATLQDGDIYEDCFAELKKEVENFHRKSNPQLYNGNEAIVSSFDGVGVIQKEKPGTLSAIIEQVKQCSEKPVLESFKLIAKKYPEIQSVYDEKMKEFV
jgi:hypothetical protein